MVDDGCRVSMRARISRLTSINVSCPKGRCSRGMSFRYLEFVTLSTEFSGDGGEEIHHQKMLGQNQRMFSQWCCNL